MKTIEIFGRYTNPENGKGAMYVKKDGKGIYIQDKNHVWRDNKAPLEKGWVYDKCQYTADYHNVVKILGIDYNVESNVQDNSGIFYNGTLTIKDYKTIKQKRLKITVLKEHYEKLGYKIAIHLNGIKFLDFPELPTLSGGTIYHGMLTYNSPLLSKSKINWILKNKEKFIAQYNKDYNIWWSLSVLGIK